MEVDGARVSVTGGMTRLDDWSLGESPQQAHVRSIVASPEDVFERDYERLVQALTLIAGTRETAADAVQEAFVQLVHHWSKVRSYDDPAGWVRRVALNQIIDRKRAFVRQARLLLRLQQQCPPPEWALESDRGLWEQVRRLPQRQRIAVALVYVGDLTARETAHVMRVSEGTVDRHLNRARQTLKEVLKDVCDE